MSTLDRFATKHAKRILERAGSRWKHTNGRGVSRVYDAIYAKPFEALGDGGVTVEVSSPRISVFTDYLHEHAVGDTWTSPDGVDYNALQSQPNHRTGMTVIPLSLP